MLIKNIKTGKDVPNNVNVIIEVSANSSEPIKYELDKIK